MTQKNSFLPAVKGGRISSFSKVAGACSLQKQRHSATDFMWKNPSFKYPRRAVHMERRKSYFGEQQHNPELFPNYEISTPEDSEAAKRNRAVDINEFVRSYVHNRQSQLPPLRPPLRCLVKRSNILRDCFHAKKKSKEISLPPLKFTEEVIISRGDPCLSSYFTTDMKKLYTLKDLSISKQRQKKEKSKRNVKPILPQKHKLCMPGEASKEKGFPLKSKCFWRKELEEMNFEDQAEKSTHLWEKYVLGFISKQTAQWIANQCSTGDQRSRLISFLDEKYKIEDAEKDGSATVYKILSLNDDCVSPPTRN